MDSKFRTSLNLKIFQCENSLSNWPVTLTNQRSTLLSAVRFAKHSIFLSVLLRRIFMVGEKGAWAVKTRVGNSKQVACPVN